MEEAASFVVDLLNHPAAEIRVAEGQLGLMDDVVVAGDPSGFTLEPVRSAPPGTVWAVDGGSCLLADGRSFQVAAYRAARVRFSEGVTSLVESPPLAPKTRMPIPASGKKVYEGQRSARFGRTGLTSRV